MRFCLVLAAFLLCSSTTIVAEDYKHKESGLSFKLPKGWTCTEKSNRIEIQNKEETLAIIGGVIPKESAREIFFDIKSFVDQLDGLDDVEITDGPNKETVNGLEQSWYSGTANVKDDNGDEQEIDWDMTIVSGGKQILFLIGLGKIDDNEKAYEKFFQSIKKTTADRDAE